MVAGDRRSKRINAAQALTDHFASSEKIPNVSHREAYLHDKIEEAVKDVCSKDGQRGNHFSQAQIDCLIEIAFTVAYQATNPNGKRGLRSRLWSGWQSCTFAEKCTIGLGGVAATPVVVAGLISIWSLIAPKVEVQSAEGLGAPPSIIAPVDLEYPLSLPLPTTTPQ